MSATLYTLGDLARHFGVKPTQVKYALEQYPVEPAQRVGILRVWDSSQLPEIERSINRTAQRPEPVPPTPEDDEVTDGED